MASYDKSFALRGHLLYVSLVPNDLVKVLPETDKFRQDLKLLDDRRVSRHYHQQSSVPTGLLFLLLLSRHHQELLELGLYGCVPAFEPNER